jgi:hypothetical protein
MQRFCPLFAAAAALGVATASHGVAIDSATFTGSTSTAGGVVITDFDIGSTTYTGLTGATGVDFDASTAPPTVEGPGYVETYFYGSGAADPTTDAAALIGLRADDGVLNLARRDGDDNLPAVDFFFAAPLTNSNGVFILDIASGDTVDVTPIDAAGNALASAVSVSTGSPSLTSLGTLEREGTAGSLSAGLDVTGVALFVSTDFGGVTGIQGVRIFEPTRITGSTGTAAAQGIDAAVVGTFVVPEPASLALLAAGGLCLLKRQRKSASGGLPRRRR